MEELDRQAESEIPDASEGCIDIFHNGLLNYEIPRENPYSVQVESDNLTEITRSYIEAARLVIERNSPRGQDLQIIGNIVPANVYDRESLDAIFQNFLLKAQQRGLELADYFIQDDADGCYIRLDKDTYVEARCIGDVKNYPLSIALCTVSAHEVQKQIGRTLEFDDEILLSTERASPADYVKIWAMAMNSIISSREGDASEIRHYVSVTGSAALDPFDKYAVETKMLIENSKTQNKRVHLERETNLLIIENLEAAFSSIGGLTDVKNKLVSIASIMIDSVGSASYNVQAPHVILHGPSSANNGALVDAFADSIDAYVLEVKPSDIDAPMYGEAPKNLVAKIDEAIKRSKTESLIVIRVYEIDALIANRTDLHGHYRSIISAFKLELDRLAEMYPNKIIMVGTTNALRSELDETIMDSEYVETIEVPLPVQFNDKLVVFQNILRNSLGTVLREIESDPSEEREMYHFDINLKSLLNMNEKMSPGDFENTLQIARREKYITSQRTGKHEQVTQADLERIARSLRSK